MKKNILLIILTIGIAIGFYQGYDYFMGGRCNPKGKCIACKNCSACKHCHKYGGTCSVCR